MYRKLGLGVVIFVIVAMVFAGCGGSSSNSSGGTSSATPSSLTMKTSITDDLIRQNTSTEWALAGTSGYQQYVETENGFNWSGYNPAGTDNAIVVDQYYDGRLIFYETANRNGSYAYTIFDANTGTTPTQAIDMSSGSFSVVIGLESSSDTSATQQIRLMVRDESGNWYLSDAKTVSYTGTNTLSSAYSYAVSDITWSAVDSTNADHMNDMDRGCTTITMSTASSVDLSKVTGTGVYIETPSAYVSGQIFKLYTITLSNS